MNASRLAYLAIVTLAALAAFSQAEAQTVGAHPAIRGAAAPAATLDPNHFLVGHPAGGAPRAVHANFSHPADVISRQGQPALDPNHFLVQPPSSVRWAQSPAEPLNVAVVR